MNTVLSSYGQLCGCPEILKKSCKFFCRGLDIRVPQPMQGDFRQLIRMGSVVYADNLLEHFVWGGYVHLPPVVLGEQVIAPFPVSP